MTVTLQSGSNVGQETVDLELKGKRKDKHLEYKAKPKLECCPNSMEDANDEEQDE